ncbi:hypothetical protein SASPL_110663 [Salvia splendens]|uniref:Angiotensin-converting enzyme 2 n=1 Tax=Salvia splendens TaxID=180675 RepID=A0A8X8YAE2_SALSN|nr:hypothetical protein SASPL_110663 [Salvia splendens]
MDNHHHLHSFPCLNCQPHTYIRMLQVQNMIERCLLFRMDRDECVKALAEHARIRPLVTLTVWKELLKENKDFFQAYFQSLSLRPYSSKNLFILISSHYKKSFYSLSLTLEIWFQIQICSKGTKIWKKKPVQIHNYKKMKEFYKGIHVAALECCIS